MLTISDLSAGYGGGRFVLHGVSLSVAAQETVAVLGANTAGKTTLIRAIQGLLPRMEGSITMQGQEITRLPPQARVSRGIALVPEGRHVFPDMTVQENLLLGAYHRRGADLTADLDTCRAVFPRLAERQHQKARSLSGGEQQMVAIARAMMARPRLLLLDEPGHGLAPLMVEEVHRAIRRITAAGVAVLLVEQNVASALSLAARAYVLEAGRITQAGSAETLAQDDGIRKTYLGI